MNNIDLFNVDRWYEGAPSGVLIEGKLVDPTPPTVEDLSIWFNLYVHSISLQDVVWHRYIMTRHGTRSLRRWAAKQFFFRNATKEQLSHLSD